VHAHAAQISKGASTQQPRTDTHHFVLGDVLLDNFEAADVLNDLGRALIDLLGGEVAAGLEDADGADAVGVERHFVLDGVK
jgi:hypothetical protein